MSREHLIDELLQREELAELAQYVQCNYPPGMVAWAKLGKDWREINFCTGTTQGRPLSPALAGILLQPCLIAAQTTQCEMARVEGLDPDGEEVARRFAIDAYIDDDGLVGTLKTVATGFAVLKQEV
jgi:hypothetical protein